MKASLWMVLAALSVPALPVAAQTASTSSTSTPASRTIQCGSDSSQRALCAAGGEIASARLVRDLSSGKCGSGGSWGWTNSAVWADNGCRAEFEVTYGRDTTPGMRPMAPPTRVISCGNASGSAMSCNAFGTVATVRLQLDRSGGRCGQSGSWGLGDKSIWVTAGLLRGLRAELHGLNFPSPSLGA